MTGSPLPPGPALLPKNALIECVGRTPLIRLGFLDRDLAGVEIYGKVEANNPGGSVKDRPALRMICKGIEEGRLRPGMRILDATSGNTGIAYAWIGGSLGFGVTLCLPKNASPERFRTLRAYGVEIIPTDPLEGTDGAIEVARGMHEKDPARFFYPDQYSNEENWRAHYETTAPEILTQMDGDLTHFVAGIGTSGTFTGTGRRLREAVPGVSLVEVQPSAPFHGLEGMKHIPTSLVPAIYDATLADRRETSETEIAQRFVRRAAHESGLLLGPSSGATMEVARRIGEEAAAAKRRARIVAILADKGDRYLEDPFWAAPITAADSGGE